MLINIIIIVLLLAVAALFVWFFLIRRQLKVFFKGKKGADLEEYIVELEERIKKLETENKNLTEVAKQLQEKTRECLRGVSAVRFNPFKDVGGNQSFAIALLNEKGDGLVLSSLYAREKISVFAKPIKNLGSEYELSAEEKEALEKAKTKS